MPAQLDFPRPRSRYLLLHGVRDQPCPCAIARVRLPEAGERESRVECRFPDEFQWCRRNPRETLGFRVKTTSKEATLNRHD